MQTLKIALLAVFSSILYVITVTVSEVLIFPIIPYLKFDPAEIIVAISLFLFGPLIALLLAFLHFILLHFPSTQYPIIGPGFKFLAESSTVIATYLAFKFSKSENLKVRLGYAILASLILRNIVMSIANYLILVTLFAGAVDPIFQGIAKITGITAYDSIGKILVILLFTAVYNSIHVFITLLPAFWISTLPFMYQLISPISKHWLIYLKENEKRIGQS